MVVLSDYTGREQSYVKHVFLEGYLERLVHKTGSTYPHVVYVDGFAGPWQSANEKFDDTSFGIALAALRSAKASWRKRGRHVKMSAFLVERDPEAYRKLEKVGVGYPDIEIKTYPADFLSVLPEILKEIPENAFAFFLIDPKGWRIPLGALAQMLARTRSEVIFNFMFDFINRAASIKDPTVGTIDRPQNLGAGNEAARLHHASRRHGGHLAGRGARPTDRDAGNRISRQRFGRPIYGPLTRAA